MQREVSSIYVHSPNDESSSSGVPRTRGGCVDYDEFVIYKQAAICRSMWRLFVQNLD